MAASLASPAETLQPSWAHVVSGARSGPQCPPPPPLLHARAAVLAGPVTEQALSRVQLSLRMDPVVPPVRDDEGKVIKFGKVLAPQFDSVVSKAVDRVEEEETVASVVRKALDTVVDMMALDNVVAEVDEVDKVPSHGADGDHAVDVQECSMDVQLSLGERTVVAAAADVAPDFCPVKKAKLSSDLDVPRDPRLRVRGPGSCSPDLHHKVAGVREQGDVSGVGNQQQQTVSEGGGDGDGDGIRNEVNYVSWFDVIIEGENDRGRLEFGFKDKDFPKTFDDYFHKFGEICTSQSHKCRGRVMGVVSGMRERVKHDCKYLLDLVEKFGDAHILDSGWIEAAPAPGDWQIG